MKKVIYFFSFFTVLILVANCCTSTSTNFFSQPEQIKQIPADGSVPDRVFLNQNWSAERSGDFWFTSQGSEIIPYSWFLWLEEANNESYFRNTNHMEELRYLPVESSEWNPGGLPIGFVKTVASKDNDTWMGLTCAACHTNQMDYNGNKILIDGAPTLGNFVLFFSELIDALSATNSDNAKFDRFAKNVLGDKYSTATSMELRQGLLEVSTGLAERQMVNDLPSDYPTDFTSYARLDAFGNIQNAGSAFALNDLSNGNPPTAPVSYPFLWGTHQSDVVQWNASAPNTPLIGPLVRNIGEVVGVFGKLSITKPNFWEKLIGAKHDYFSTVDMHGLGLLEGYVKELRSPQWPENYLTSINIEKAAAGHLLFEEHCTSCHQIIPRANEGKKYKAVKTPLMEVGTDKAMAWNAAYHVSNSLSLEGSKKEIIIGDKFKKKTASLDISVNGVVGVVLKHPIKAIEAGITTAEIKKESSMEDYVKKHLERQDSIEQSHTLLTSAGTDSDSSSNKLNGLVYKARPLNGIWATAPFLHNGSVASLWELLLKSEDRMTSFWVGDRTFDPVKVGFNTESGLNEFKVLKSDGTIMLGNSNKGHEYGTGLTVDEKWALIEYMKTL